MQGLLRSYRWAWKDLRAELVGAENAVTPADLASWASELADLLRGHLSLGHCQYPRSYGSPT